MTTLSRLLEHLYNAANGEMRIYGKNPILERLKSNPKSIKKIYLEEDHSEAGYIRTKAKQWGIPVFSVPREKMFKMSRNINAQGMFVEIEEFSYVGYDDLLDAATEKQYTLLFMDNLNDPQNLGSIIRVTACLGKFSLVLPTHDSVGVTEAVLRVASGGDNHVSISQVSNLGQAIAKAKKQGFWMVGASVGAGQNLYATQFNFPLGLVVGSEQKGIRDIIKKQLDVEVTIPLAHPRLSLNVSQAVTAFCYEITKQKINQK